MNKPISQPKPRAKEGDDHPPIRPIGQIIEDHLDEIVGTDTACRLRDEKRGGQ